MERRDGRRARPLIRDDDVSVEKVRMNGVIATHLDQVQRTQGIATLYFSGVNIDQCVSSTMVFDAKQCWVFSTTTETFAAKRFAPRGA
jgi:nicotinamidase-related amidase